MDHDGRLCNCRQGTHGPRQWLSLPPSVSAMPSTLVVSGRVACTDTDENRVDVGWIEGRLMSLT